MDSLSNIYVEKEFQMNEFKLTEDGSQITVESYRCQNSQCQKCDHMRRLLTSLTPSSDSIQLTLNPAKDSVKRSNEYLDIHYERDVETTEEFEYYTEEVEYYTWDFVECRSCRMRYILEASYFSIVGELSNSLFPLFYVR